MILLQQKSVIRKGGIILQMDRYTCRRCKENFAVEQDTDPKACSNCLSPAFEFDTTVNTEDAIKIAALSQSAADKAINKYPKSILQIIS